MIYKKICTKRFVYRGLHLFPITKIYTLKVMEVRNLLKLRLDSRKQISLYVGSKYKRVDNILGLKPFDVKNFTTAKDGETYFVGTNSAYNNKVLVDFLEGCKAIVANNPQLEKPKDIVETYLNGGTKKVAVVTFDSFISEYINTLRYEEEGKGTFRKYKTIKNNVETYLPSLSIKPIKDITNKDFVELGDVLTRVAPAAYKETMKFFQATINKAREKELCHSVLCYKWKNHIPTSTISHTHRYIEDVERVLNFDVSTLKTKINMEKRTLYLDIIRFLYYSTSRPCDVIRFRLEDIAFKDGKDGTKIPYWSYLPKKKERRVHLRAPEKAMCPLNKEMKAIIGKYKDKSVDGYLFPVACNTGTKHKSKETQTNMCNQLERAISAFLKEIGIALELGDINLYDFRHTRTTDLNKAGITVGAIAGIAGTSVKMLDNTYIKKEELVWQEIEKYM